HVGFGHSRIGTSRGPSHVVKHTSHRRRRIPSPTSAIVKLGGRVSSSNRQPGTMQRTCSSGPPRRTRAFDADPHLEQTKAQTMLVGTISSGESTIALHPPTKHP